jgi:N-formylglutamate deformylase
VIPRLFKGTLAHFNIGTNDGGACDPALKAAIVSICAETDFSHVVNGRFKGGFITRSLGRPQSGIHAVQMELACRGYMREPQGPVTNANWPSAYDRSNAAPMRAVLTRILQACLDFAAAGAGPGKKP